MRNSVITASRHIRRQLLKRRPLACVVVGFASMLAFPALAEQDPGIRGGLQNTAGYLQLRRVQQHDPKAADRDSAGNPVVDPRIVDFLGIPRPPLIARNPTRNPITGNNEPANPNEEDAFAEGILRAGQLESTCDSCGDVTDGAPAIGLGELDPLFPQFHTNSNGLGARHNGDQCLACHAQPTLGGSGGFLVPNPGSGTPQTPENPMFSLMSKRFGKQNVIPAFEQQFGPIREARFKFNPDGTRDGGVHQLWVITGIGPQSTQVDPAILNCHIVQPDFAAQVRANNVSFRIPLQLFGLGLIDSIQDREILARQAATASQRAPLRIGGHPNLSGNDSTINRFGWKAQNKSLTLFSGEAYNVEQGVTNELNPQSTEEDPACNNGVPTQFDPATGKGVKPAPNDVMRTKPDDLENQFYRNPRHIMADWMQFTFLMRFMDPPNPDPVAIATPSARLGRVAFDKAGCNLCHTPQMQTAPGMNSLVLQNRPVNLFSDLLLHSMGPNLADDIVQGKAGPEEFRTQPLWGVGQRMFFLHDGRTSDLKTAILAHRSTYDSDKFKPSEANAVIDNYTLRLTDQERQGILDFLRAL